MNSFVKGLLVGVGIGMIVAPMRGEEMRRLLGQRAQELRGYLPENEQVNQYVQQVSDRVTQASSDLKDYAQQAASKVKDTSSSLGTLAQQAAGKVKQTGQDVADTTKQAATSAKRSASATDTAPFPSAYPEYVNPEKNG
ncbi:MAG TPA: YtxH domain-containing protein [Ktedonobacteraceae bacterium]|jgi:gas vesicle protein|nr:YtxH domain-containing protein [Ktedonobacteraceae bacterium]HYL42978.1 YtxH domain-containing protein [Ktedonobacteraceae bacterium]